MHFENPQKSQKYDGKMLLTYVNDSGGTVVIAHMKGAHLLNAYTKYLGRMVDGEYTKYVNLVNGLKHELAQRLAAYPLDPNMCEK